MQDPQKLFDAAIAELQAGKWQEGARMLDALAEYDLNNPVVLVNLGIALAHLGQKGAAISLLSYCADLEPNDPSPWVNLGATFEGGLHRDFKRKALERAVSLKPDSADALCNLSGTYVQDGNPDPGIEYGRKCVAINPAHINGHNNLGLLLLEKGEWAEAWTHWAWRRKMPESTGRNYAPLWDGSPVDTLVIHGEQGIGDEIMFLPYVNLAAERAKRVVIEVNPKIVSLVRRAYVLSKFEVIGAEAEYRGKADAQIPMGDLPRLLDMPTPVRASYYLAPDPARVRYWQLWLAERGPKPWVAMALHGGVRRTHEIVRNPPRDAWRPVIEAAGGAYSIQYGAKGAQIAAEVGVPHVPLPADDLSEQAAFIAACSCLVAVPQTALHIGGAIGATVHGVISDKPAWRYGIAGPMPWYRDNVTLHRMGADGWGGLMERIAQAVRA